MSPPCCQLLFSQTEAAWSHLSCDIETEDKKCVHLRNSEYSLVWMVRTCFYCGSSMSGIEQYVTLISLGPLTTKGFVLLH